MAVTTRDPVLIVFQDGTGSVQPGAEVRCRVKIRNVGDIIERYGIEVVGDAAAWARVTSTSREFDPAPAGETSHIDVDKRAEDEIELTFVPPPLPSTPAGHVAAGVRVFSTTTDASTVEEVHLQVGGTTALHADLDPRERAGRWKARYTLTVHNNGNEPARVEASAKDSKKALTITTTPKAVAVPPEGSAEIGIEVAPQSPALMGRPTNHSFEVAYRQVLGAVDPSAPPTPPAIGSYEQKPVLSKIVLVVLGLLFVGLVALVLWVRSQTTEESAPPVPMAPTGFAASASSDSITLGWNAFAPGALGDGFRISLSRNGVAAGTIQDTDGVQQGILTVIEAPAGSPLEPDTEYCFTIQTLLAEETGQPSEERCAQLAPFDLPTPTLGAITQADGEEALLVNWEYEDEADSFSLKVDGSQSFDDVTPGAKVPLEPGEHCIALYAHVGDHISPPSEEQCVPVTPVGESESAAGAGDDAGSGSSPTTPSATDGGVGSTPGTSSVPTAGPGGCSIDGWFVIYYLKPTDDPSGDVTLDEASAQVDGLFPGRTRSGTASQFGLTDQPGDWFLGLVDGFPAQQQAELAKTEIADGTDLVNVFSQPPC